jgi:hypothetical protein
VQRKDEFSVSFAKPGYQPQTVPVTTRLAGGGAAGFAGNVLVGGIVGMGVDAASGATLEHWPNPVVATLQPVAPVPQPPGRRRKDGPPVVSQRRPPPPTIAPIPAAMVTTEPEPALSEADRTMLMRNWRAVGSTALVLEL